MHPSSATAGHCRASVNPGPDVRPSPDPSNSAAASCLLLPPLLPTGGVLLQRPGRLPFRHVSVIQGRNLAHPPGLPRRVQPASPRHKTHRHDRGGHGARRTLFVRYVCRNVGTAFCSTPAWARPRENARRASSLLPPPSLPCRHACCARV